MKTFIKHPYPALLLVLFLGALLLPGFSNAATIDVQVAVSADDIRVHWNNNLNIWLASIIGTQGWLGHGSTEIQRAGVASRFLNLNIPKSAIIDNATLTMTGDHSFITGNNVNLILTGEKTNASATFSNLANYQSRRGTVVGGV